MNKLLKILLFSLAVCLSAKAQVPAGLPNPKGTSYYEIGWMQTDSGLIAALRDTTLRPRFPGTFVFWQHATVDSNFWFYDGARFFHYLKTGQDVFNAIGGIPVLSITTNNTSGPATLVNGVLNIPQYAGGGGGGGNIVSLNGLTAAAQFLVVGNTGTDFNIVSTIATTTFNIPTGGPGARGLISTSDWSTFNNKQNQLNGTGFVKATGSTISYDNSAYYLASNPSGYITLTSLSAFSPILYNNSTGVISADTSVGLTKLATQAYANTHGGSGAITTVGNLSPIFTTTVISNNLSFSLTNATANTVLGNFTGSPAPPTYGLLPLASMAAITANRLIGDPTGSSATPSLIPLGYGLIFQAGALAVDTAHLKDTIYAANGLQTLGSTMDSIGLGGTLYLNTTITTSSFGLRVNFGADQGYDMIVRDSTTGYWKRIVKGTPGQSLQMLSGGGIGWAAQSGSGGGSNLTDTTIYATVSAGSSTYSSGLTSTVIVNVAYNGVIVPGVAHTGFNSYSYNSGTGVFTFTGITFSTGDNLQITYRAVGSGGGGGSCSGCLINTNNLSDVSSLATSLNNLLPSQTGNSGKYLQTNGTTASWATASGSRNLTSQSFTSGSSGTISGGNTAVYIDPSSTITSFALTTPASPSDGDEIWITGGGTLTTGIIVTTLTMVANSGQSIPQNFGTSLGFQQSIAWRYRVSNTTWYKFQ